MPTRYLDINPIAPPADLGLDATGRRVRIGFSVNILKASSDAFEDELAKVLTTAGISASAIFIGSNAVIPDGDGPYIHIRAYPGAAALRTHDRKTTPAIERPNAQVVAIATIYAVARTSARAAYAAFYAVRNTDITP